VSDETQPRIPGTSTRAPESRSALFRSAAKPTNVKPASNRVHQLPMLGGPKKDRSKPPWRKTQATFPGSPGTPTSKMRHGPL
jgi:hypothetical protein